MHISLQIQTSKKRKSIGIQVYPDCSVKIKVPQGLSEQKINEIIQQKQNWINKKIQYFQANQVEIKKQKEYIDDEIFYYLGKQYKLKIVESQFHSIERTNDTIFIHKTQNNNVKNVVKKWFSQLAKEVFEERLKINFAIFSKELQYPFPTLKIRKMKARWGSMSSKGKMTLNTHLIHTSIECIDYVIIHELCHLKHQNHGEKFYQLQGKFNPHYKEIKKKLETFGNTIGLL